MNFSIEDALVTAYYAEGRRSIHPPQNGAVFQQKTTNGYTYTVGAEPTNSDSKAKRLSLMQLVQMLRPQAEQTPLAPKLSLILNHLQDKQETGIRGALLGLINRIYNLFKHRTLATDAEAAKALAKQYEVAALSKVKAYVYSGSSHSALVEFFRDAMVWTFHQESLGPKYLEAFTTSPNPQFSYPAMAQLMKWNSGLSVGKLDEITLKQYRTQATKLEIDLLKTSSQWKDTNTLIDMAEFFRELGMPIEGAILRTALLKPAEEWSEPAAPGTVKGERIAAAKRLAKCYGKIGKKTEMARYQELAQNIADESA